MNTSGFTNKITCNLGRPEKQFGKAFDSTWALLSDKVAQDAVGVVREEIERAFAGWQPSDELTAKFPILNDVAKFVELYSEGIKFELDDKEKTIKVFVDPEFYEKARVSEAFLDSVEFGAENVPLLVHWRTAASIYTDTFRNTSSVFAKKITETLRRAK